MSLKNNQDKDIIAYDDRTRSISIKDISKGTFVEQVEITNECIEQIADAVVRKLKEVKHE